MGAEQTQPKTVLIDCIFLNMLDAVEKEGKVVNDIMISY